MTDFLQPRRFPTHSAQPRWLPWMLLATLLLSGLIGHDPWKVEDASHFGVVWSMIAHGQWLAPHLAGELWSEAPLAYWIAALFAMLGSALGLASHDAARLASALFTALSCTFLALAARELYGKARAIAAPLALAGCLGLLIHSHETQPAMAILASQSAALWGLALLPRQAKRGGMIYGLALASLSLSGGLAMLPLTLLPLLSSITLSPQRSASLRGLLMGLPFAALAAAWPLALALSDPAALSAWWAAEWQQFADNASGSNFLAFSRLLPWFAWPALPLATWTLWLRRRDLLALPQLLPLLAFIGAWISVALAYQARSVGALPLLPPLALLAAGGIGEVRRGAANGFDWFAMITFSLLSALVWLGWTAMVFGLPAEIAHNFAKLEPGFTAHFSWPAVAVASAASIAWFWLIFTSPRTPYRGLTHWLAGMTLTWLLTVSLWFPWVDYGKTYRPLAVVLAKQLRTLNAQGCIAGQGLAEAQRASFDYFANLRTVAADSPAGHHCQWLLKQSTSANDEELPPATKEAPWIKHWEGHRPGDKVERFRLYQREPSDAANR